MQPENKEQLKQRLSEMKRELAKKEKKLELKCRLQEMKNELAKTQKKLEKASRSARVKAHVQKKLKDLAGRSSPDHFKEYYKQNVDQVSHDSSNSHLDTGVIPPDSDSAGGLVMDVIPPSQSTQLSQGQITPISAAPPMEDDGQVNGDENKKISKNVFVKITEEKNQVTKCHTSNISTPNCSKTVDTPEATMCSQHIVNYSLYVNSSNLMMGNPVKNSQNSREVKGENITVHLDENAMKFTEKAISSGDTCERAVFEEQPGIYIPIKRRVSRRRRKPLSLKKNKTETFTMEDGHVECTCSTGDSSSPGSVGVVNCESSQTLKGSQIMNGKISSLLDGTITAEFSDEVCGALSENSAHDSTIATRIMQDSESRASQHDENDKVQEIQPDSTAKSVHVTVACKTEQISDAHLNPNFSLENGTGACSGDKVPFPGNVAENNEQKEMSHHDSQNSCLPDSEIVVFSQTASIPRKRRHSKSRNWSSECPARKSSRIAAMESSQSSSSLDGSFLQFFSQVPFSPNTPRASMKLPKWFDGVSQSLLSQSPRLPRRTKSRKIFPCLPRLILEQHIFVFNFVDFSLPAEDFAELCNSRSNQTDKTEVLGESVSTSNQDGSVSTDVAEEAFAQREKYVNAKDVVEDRTREATLIPKTLKVQNCEDSVGVAEDTSREATLSSKTVEEQLHTEKVEKTIETSIEPGDQNRPCVKGIDRESLDTVHSETENGEGIKSVSDGTRYSPLLHENIAVDSVKVGDAPTLSGTSFIQESAMLSLSNSQFPSPSAVLPTSALNSSYKCIEVVEDDTAKVLPKSGQTQRCFKIPGDDSRHILCLLSGEFLENGKMTDYVVVVSDHSVSVWIQKASIWESRENWEHESSCGECKGSTLPCENQVSFVTMKKDDRQLSVDVYACGGDAAVSTCIPIYNIAVENYTRFQHCILVGGDVVLCEYCPMKNQSHVWKCVLQKGRSSAIAEQKLEPVCGEVTTILSIPGHDDALIGYSRDGFLHIWDHNLSVLLTSIDIHISNNEIDVVDVLEEQGLLFVCVLFHESPSIAGSMVMVNPHSGRSKTFYDYITPARPFTTCRLKDSCIQGDKLIALEEDGRLLMWDVFSGDLDGWAELADTVCFSAARPGELYLAQKSGCIHFIKLL